MSLQVMSRKVLMKIFKIMISYKKIRMKEKWVKNKWCTSSNTLKIRGSSTVKNSKKWTLIKFTATEWTSSLLKWMMSMKMSWRMSNNRCSCFNSSIKWLISSRWITKWTNMDRSTEKKWNLSSSLMKMIMTSKSMTMGRKWLIKWRIIWVKDRTSNDQLRWILNKIVITPKLTTSRGTFCKT